MNTATSTAHKVTRHAVVKGRILRLVEVERVEEFLFSLYKKLFHFKALLFESIILLPPPPCKAYPIAIRLHDHCAMFPSVVLAVAPAVTRNLSGCTLTLVLTLQGVLCG